MTISRAILASSLLISLTACGGNGSTIGGPANQISSAGHKIVQSGTKWVILPLPKGGSDPELMTNGPDGNVWFTENAGNSIDRVDVLTGAITRFPISDPNASPLAITTGADGNFWFCEGNSPTIGVMTPGGAFTSYPLPLICSALAATPDGNIWANGGNEIQRITSGGAVSQFPTPSGHTPFKLAVGSDGNVWFTEQETCPHNCRRRHPFGKITPTGSITEYNWLGLRFGTRYGFTGDMVLGHDGALYSIFGYVGQVLRILPDGSAMLSGRSQFRAENLVVGSSGTLYEADRRGHISDANGKAGPPPPDGHDSGDMVFASDGNLWITQPEFNSIAVLLKNRIRPEPTSITISVGGSDQLGISEESYTQGWQVVSTDPAIATVTMISQTQYNVTGVSTGACSIQITDVKNNQISVPVTVN